MASSITDSYGAGDDGGGGFMLFGVRVTTEGSFRKSASMNNLVQYDDHQPQDSNSDAVVAAAGYASDDVVHPSGRIRDRKRGVAWSEEEHRLFLLGLQSVGKGDWRGISRNYVKTRTPTQVASHAQKYFLRRSNHNRRRRRSSLFDMTTNEVVGSSAEDQIQILQQDSPIIPPPPPPQHNHPNNPTAMAVTIPPIPIESSLENLSYGQLNQLTNSPNPIMPIPILPIAPSSAIASLNLNKTTTITTTHDPPFLSLNLSMSPSQSVTQDEEQSPSSNHQSPSARQASTFQTMTGTTFSGGSGGDSIISVA